MWWDLNEGSKIRGDANKLCFALLGVVRVVPAIFGLFRGNTVHYSIVLYGTVQENMILHSILLKYYSLW